MEIVIEKMLELDPQLELSKPIKFFNPNGMDHSLDHRIKAIEMTDDYTRIDFIYRSSMIWDNGGWIQMDKDAYIQPVGSVRRYRLVKAVNIPIAPIKHYFKRKGEYHTYTLIFPPLPEGTSKIHIIEKEAPGNYFNFYNVDYSKWMTIPHAMDLPISNN